MPRSKRPRGPRLGIQPLLFLGLAGLLTVAGIIAALVAVYPLGVEAEGQLRAAALGRLQATARWINLICDHVDDCAPLVEAQLEDDPTLSLHRQARGGPAGGVIFDVLSGQSRATRRAGGRAYVATPVHLDGQRHALLSDLALTPLRSRVARQSWVVLGLLAINFTLILLFGLYLSGRHVIRPLKRLTAGAASGEIPRLGGPREIEALSEGFATLFERLSAQKAALERKNAELEAAHVTLARSEELASVGRLAAGVAHEIGNPLSAVIGYLDYLKDARGVDAELQRELIGRMDKSLERMRLTLRQLLDYSRPSAAAPEPFEARAWLDEALAFARYQSKARKLTVEIEGEGAVVYAPPERIRQVLVNLVLNAADATGGVGRLRISLRREGGWLIIAVEDDGPGIDAADAPRLFDPFFTTKPAGEGTGLGLAISQRLMEEAGGALRLASARPARFEVSLPLHAEAGG